MNEEFGLDTGPRVLIYILLDVSGSMCGAPIQAVNEGLELIEKELRRVPEAIEMAHISVVTFGSSASNVVKLTEVSKFRAPKLGCGGGTDMASALKMVNDLVDKDFRPTFKGQARGDYKPLLFLLTDGEPNDLNAAIREAEKLRNRESGKRIGTFVALGCGPAVNERNLRQITETVAMMVNMTPENIRAFFKWVSASVIGASKRASQAAGGAGNMDIAPPVVPDGSDGAPAFKFTF